MGVRVRQKTKGKGRPWYVFVCHNGKRKSKKFSQKKAAVSFAKEVEQALATGAWQLKDEEKKIPIFGKYSEKWLKGYVKTNLRESTFDEYESVLRIHLLPVFKHTRIDEISRGDIRELLLKKHAGGLSQKRVTLIKDVISGVLGDALDSELISVNPTVGIMKKLFPKNGKKKAISENEFFSQEELDLFLDTSEMHFPGYYPFFFTACRSGMRLGELLALRWDDIDFNSSYIWVRRSYRRGRYTKPKNGRERKTDMSNQLSETLQAYLTRQKRQALIQGTGGIPELVFHRDGKVIEQNFIRRVYTRILKKAKLRYVKFHGLRHTFCAHLLSAGISPYYVSQQAGHSSINITCDVYGSWITNDDNRHVNVLDSKPQNCTPYAPCKNEKPQPFEITANSL